MFEAAKSIAVIVAHPDDETLFAGGLLARFGYKCTVICCTIPLRDPERAELFKNACEVFGARSKVLPFREGGFDVPLQNFPELCGFNAIVTHNAQGEYGHLHHKQVHKYVSDNAEVPVYTFQGERNLLQLTASEIETRMRALKCYNHLQHYGGRMIPKWQALLERYGDLPLTEGYNAH